MNRKTYKFLCSLSLFLLKRNKKPLRKVITYELVLILHEVFKRDLSVNVTCAHHCKPLHHRKLIPRRGFRQLLQVVHCIDRETGDGGNRGIQAMQDYLLATNWCPWLALMLHDLTSHSSTSLRCCSKPSLSIDLLPVGWRVEPLSGSVEAMWTHEFSHASPCLKIHGRLASYPSRKGRKDYHLLGIPASGHSSEAENCCCLVTDTKDGRRISWVASF